MILGFQPRLSKRAMNLDAQPDRSAERMKKTTKGTELVWTKKGFDYVLRVADGYKFVRGWRKRRVPALEKKSAAR